MSDPVNLVSLIASIASLVLAIVAIALSIVFFVLGLKQANEAQKASTGIEGSVSRLETLFDRLYSDTFSMVKKTMDDMSNHIWRREDLVETPNEEAQQSSELLAELERVSREVGIAHDKIGEMQQRMEPVVRESVNEAANKIPPRVRISHFLQVRDRQNRPALTFREIVARFHRSNGLATGEIASALFDLRENGRVTWDGDADSLHPDAVITWIPKAPVTKPAE